MGNAGNSDFVKGIVDWNKRRYGIDNIDPKMIGITAGVIPGIVSALQAFAPKGSKVLMVTPTYVGFYAAIGFTKTVPEESPMKMVNGRYEIDWADFETPHDPGGEGLDPVQSAQSGRPRLDQGGTHPLWPALQQAQHHRPVGRDPLRLRLQGPQIRALCHPGQGTWSTIPSPSSRAPRASRSRR